MINNSKSQLNDILIKFIIIFIGQAFSAGFFSIFASLFTSNTFIHAWCVIFKIFIIFDISMLGLIVIGFYVFKFIIKLGNKNV